MRKEPSLQSARAIRVAAAVASLAVFAVAAVGCGGDDAGAEETAAAIVGLYVIDHDGANPVGDALAPYTKAFRRVQRGCEITAEELASSVVRVAGMASGGSGTLITNLDALRAMARAVGTTPQDCRGVFVGVEARLEGGALDE